MMIPWANVILGRGSAQESWNQLFENLLELGRASTSSFALDHSTIEPDRLLAEAAWDLWDQYAVTARRTTRALREWWNVAPTEGRAILILDALSLRELSALLGGATSRN